MHALLIAWLREMLSRTEMHERKGITGKIYTRKGMTRKKYLALVECWKGQREVTARDCSWFDSAGARE